jgi:hypothetical protein
VSGRATQQVVDRDGEMMDYASSKPEFMKWSAEVFKDSGGKSHGNLRSMHGNVCAGKLTNIQFLDDEKAIDITAKIIDDNEWEKIKEGAYGGFSIGGRYSKKWQDVSTGTPITRYTAVPSEISIVDRPSCPTAKFVTIHKRDGSTVRRYPNRNQTLITSMNRFQKLLQEHGMNSNSDIAAIRKVHARGARPLPADLLHKYEPDAAQAKDRSIRGVRKALRSTLRKAITLPRQDTDLVDTGGIADTGASNNWHDENSAGDTPKPVRIGGQLIGTPAKSDFDAVLDALKRDFARGAKSFTP